MKAVRWALRYAQEELEQQIDEIITAIDALIRAKGGDMPLADRVLSVYIGGKNLKRLDTCQNCKRDGQLGHPAGCGSGDPD